MAHNIYECYSGLVRIGHLVQSNSALHEILACQETKVTIIQNYEHMNEELEKMMY